MPSRWDAATHGWSRRVFHYPLPTLMSRNFRLPRTIELQPLSLTPLKMRKVELRVWLKTPSPLVREGWGEGPFPRYSTSRPRFTRRFLDTSYDCCRFSLILVKSSTHPSVSSDSASAYSPGCNLTASTS